MDLPIMGNRYEHRERRACNTRVVCTSAATSQIRARVNRNTVAHMESEDRILDREKESKEEEDSREQERLEGGW